MKKKLIKAGRASTCYFRSSVQPPFKKALLQITEKCNLFCAHCFIFSGLHGIEMSLDSIRKEVIPKFKDFNVVSVTLTGGEPFMHPEIMEIVRQFANSGFNVGICTNGTLISPLHAREMSAMGNIHLNVSLDGFKPESHGKFRGSTDCFSKTVNVITLLSKHGLLQGILVTPNAYSSVEEYVQICKFAAQSNAAYVLMNPLSSMGRGAKSKQQLGASRQTMREIRKQTSHLQSKVEIVYVRFPNDEKLPLGGCEEGNIFYVFASGDVAICPYKVFAAKNPGSKHEPSDFVIGNIFDSIDLETAFKNYGNVEACNIPICELCINAKECGRGCPAAIMALGNELGNIDVEMCPLL
jgi:MoaA/NifB/PqqE/SkfB family radical SAM enzyme